METMIEMIGIGKLEIEGTTKSVFESYMNAKGHIFTNGEKYALVFRTTAGLKVIVRENLEEAVRNVAHSLNMIIDDLSTCKIEHKWIKLSYNSGMTSNNFCQYTEKYGNSEAGLLPIGGFWTIEQIWPYTNIVFGSNLKCKYCGWRFDDNNHQCRPKPKIKNIQNTNFNDIIDDIKLSLKE